MVLARWCAFAAYWVVFFSLPPTLLWGLPGLIGGAAAACLLLLALRLRGIHPILQTLKAQPLGAAQAPIFHALVQEHCRRLGLRPPRLYRLPSGALNIAALGFSRRSAALLVTQGLLDKMPRAELSAMVARALCRVWSTELAGETWLARMLQLFQRVSSMPEGLGPQQRDRLLLRYLFRQILLYPISLPAAWLLHSKRQAGALDQAASRVCTSPRALAEAYRRIEATAEHTALYAPFSTRHLFLVSPLTVDPLARVLFSRSGLNQRIQAIEAFKPMAVAPT